MNEANRFKPAAGPEGSPKARHAELWLDRERPTERWQR
jgi:hypothetical protein